MAGPRRARPVQALPDVRRQAPSRRLLHNPAIGQRHCLAREQPMHDRQACGPLYRVQESHALPEQVGLLVRLHPPLLASCVQLRLTARRPGRIKSYPPEREGRPFGRSRAYWETDTLGVGANWSAPNLGDWANATTYPWTNADDLDPPWACGRGEPPSEAPYYNWTQLYNLDAVSCRRSLAVPCRAWAQQCGWLP